MRGQRYCCEERGTSGKAVKAAGLESEPCVTAAYQIQGHGYGAVLKERTYKTGPRYAFFDGA
jgi:hypothetical protein